MNKKYLIDTSIWIDFYEDRFGYKNEPLGDFAHILLSLIMARHDNILMSKLTIRELEKMYSISEINGMMQPFRNILTDI